MLQLIKDVFHQDRKKHLIFTFKNLSCKSTRLRWCVVVGRNLLILHQSPTKTVVPDSHSWLLSGQVRGRPIAVAPMGIEVKGLISGQWGDILFRSKGHQHRDQIRYKSDSWILATFIWALRRPIFRGLFPWTGTTILSRTPSLKKIWWLPLILAKDHPWSVRRRQKSLPEICFKQPTQEAGSFCLRWDRKGRFRDKVPLPREDWLSVHPSNLPGCDILEERELLPKIHPHQPCELQQLLSLKKCKPVRVTGKNGHLRVPEVSTSFWRS